MMELKEWRQVGFDLSHGAVEYAKRRKAEDNEIEATGEESCKRIKSMNEASVAASSSSPPSSSSSVSISSSSSPLSDFIVFPGDMISFVDTLAHHAPGGGIEFDIAHCLVSSLKHLLRFEDVFRHFEQVHRVLVDDGIYVVAIHIHVLDGESHFDRWARYGRARINKQANFKYSSEQHRSTTVTAADTADDPPSSLDSHPPSSPSCSAPSSPSSSFDPTEIDDAFERDYTRGNVNFKAELITYAPDPSTMMEKVGIQIQRRKVCRQQVVLLYHSLALL